MTANTLELSDKVCENCGSPALANLPAELTGQTLCPGCAGLQCSDCGRAIAYDTEANVYRHLEHPALGCFLIPAETKPAGHLPDGTVASYWLETDDWSGKLWHQVYVMRKNGKHVSADRTGVTYTDRKIAEADVTRLNDAAVR